MREDKEDKNFTGLAGTREMLLGCALHLAHLARGGCLIEWLSTLSECNELLGCKIFEHRMGDLASVRVSWKCPPILRC